jgi:ribose transport system permease protein
MIANIIITGEMKTASSAELRFRRREDVMTSITRNKVAVSTPLGLQFWRLFDKVGPLSSFVILLLVTAIRPSFTRPIFTIGLQASVNGLLAIGETFVIVAGGIDLSVGTMMSLSMVVMAISTMTLGLPAGVSRRCPGRMLGGLINGFLIAFGKIPTFIVTLGCWASRRHRPEAQAATDVWFS